MNVELITFSVIVFSKRDDQFVSERDTNDKQEKFVQSQDIETGKLRTIRYWSQT